jgi:hypothetical protein
MQMDFKEILCDDGRRMELAKICLFCNTDLMETDCEDGGWMERAQGLCCLLVLAGPATRGKLLLVMGDCTDM